MSKIMDVILRLDERKPNAFTTQQKMAWLTELDGKIAAEVMLLSIVEVRLLKCTDPNHELLVTYPHDGIYDAWLEAKIDYANGEYSKYQNSKEMFNAAYGSFVRWFAQTYDPAQGYRGEEPDYVH